MRNIHFIGIGGIGCSGLASIYLHKGYKVSGSDLKASEITKSLKQKGAKIYIGHKKSNVPKNVDLIIYSPAIPKNNPELQNNIKQLSYPEALGELAKNYFTIAVAGTHGKSTTASMLAQILIKAKFDPGFIIGTKPGSRVGKGKYLIIEACEYKDSFLNYFPDILLITNIEADHLDYFKDLNHIKSSFNRLKKQSKKVINYKKENIKLQVPGKHNQDNASAAVAVARELGIKDKISKKALLNYKGVWRRFEIRGKLNGAVIIDDYAHHPTEIKAVLQAAKEKYKNKTIIAVFQAHHQNRLNNMFNNFAKSFKDADRVIITDTYIVPGRKEKAKYTAKDLAIELKAEFIGFKNLKNHIKKIASRNQVILILGAGDIVDISKKLCLD